MSEVYTKRLVFDVEPRELVRLLRGHAKVKAGPFSWKVRHEGRELGLYLVVKKADEDGFEGMVSTILYRKPGGSFLAEEGEPVAMLHGTRVREGETIVLMKCPKPKATGHIFVNFSLGMEQLQLELAKLAPQTAHHPLETHVESDSPGLAQPTGTSETLPTKLVAAAAVPADDELSAPPGRPGLDHDELIYRLAKAQEGEELKRKSPREPWKWIAREVEWSPGADEPGLALLRDARLRLHRLRPDDPLLAEVAVWRKAKEKKETKET
jgi:hypothetical protein